MDPPAAVVNRRVVRGKPEERIDVEAPEFNREETD
jgi:hypothetical protein